MTYSRLCAGLTLYCDEYCVPCDGLCVPTVPELPPDLDRLVARATFALTNALKKVDAASPSWEELPTLLTEDELRTFLVFIGRFATARDG